jgi:hypothetical protein
VHGLPEHVDLSFLEGLVLEQVAVGQFQTQLRFEDRVTISIEGEVTIDGARRVGVDAGARLVWLVGRSVQRAGRAAPGDLCLAFAGEPVAMITVHDSNDEYESYTIEGPRGLVVV